MKNILLILLVLFCGLGFKCGGNGSVADGTYRGQFYSDVQAQTLKGARVLSRTAINPAILAPIDEGLDNLFRIAAGEPNNYQIGLQHSLWNVYLFPRSSRCEYASFLVETSNTQYDGSIWDKNPRPGEVAICVAGMVVGTNNYSMLIADDAAGAALITQYEGEHILIFQNEPKRYEQTITHNENNSHPILKNTIFQPPENIKEVSITLPEDLQFGETIVKKGEKVCALITK